MDLKLVSAFAAGAALASGIVYFAVRPQDLATKPVVMQAPAPAPLPTPQIAVAPPPAPVTPAVAHVRRPVPQTPVREKPSPMPPPVHREIPVRQEPVAIARYDPPPAPATPPSPAPVPAAAPASAPAPVENVPVQNVSLPAPNVEARVPHVVTLAAGMSLAVRIGETISSARNQPGDSFLATLTQPLVLDGFIIAERGARLEGRVVDAAPAGRGRGTSHLAVSVVRIATADGQNLRIRTEPYTKDGPSPAAMDAAKVGGGARDVQLTRGKAAEIPVETRISFKVQDSVTITERLD